MSSDASPFRTARNKINNYYFIIMLRCYILVYCHDKMSGMKKLYQNKNNQCTTKKRLRPYALFLAISFLACRLAVSSLSCSSCLQSLYSCCTAQLIRISPSNCTCYYTLKWLRQGSCFPSLSISHKL